MSVAIAVKAMECEQCSARAVNVLRGELERLQPLAVRQLPPDAEAGAIAAELDPRP